MFNRSNSLIPWLAVDFIFGHTFHKILYRQYASKRRKIARTKLISRSNHPSRSKFKGVQASRCQRFL